MESSSVDSSVSSLTMMDEDELIPHQFSSITKLHNNGPGTTSVHELLECPVCTSSMYPPIHQVCYLIHSASWVPPILLSIFVDLIACFFFMFRLCDLLMLTSYLLFYFLGYGVR